MRFTLSRREQKPKRAAIAAALGLGVLAAGGLFAAPGATARWGLPALSLPAGEGYAVRFTLPSRQQTPSAATPGAREAPLAVLGGAVATPEDADPEREVAVASALPAGPQPTVVRPGPRSKVAGVIPLAYSLAGGADADDAIAVEKPIVVAGVDSGRIPLRIDGNAKVYALGSRLAAIIAAQGGARVPEGLAEDFVSLERLRALGIAVRYDPIRDRLVIEPPGA
ncbi:MAG: hypothetical protein LC648_03195 [Novosphingobium sp.]|nr:hypothetical protein [Novosphingobium sp.]